MNLHFGIKPFERLKLHSTCDLLQQLKLKLHVVRHIQLTLTKYEFSS